MEAIGVNAFAGFVKLLSITVNIPVSFPALETIGESYSDLSWSMRFYCIHVNILFSNIYR